MWSHQLPLWVKSVGNCALVMSCMIHLLIESGWQMHLFFLRSFQLFPCTQVVIGAHITFLNVDQLRQPAVGITFRPHSLPEVLKGEERDDSSLTAGVFHCQRKTTNWWLSGFVVLYYKQQTDSRGRDCPSNVILTLRMSLQVKRSSK